MKVIFVIGTTGTGKSEIALKIAKLLKDAGRFDPHLINCDVMQMLPGLPIGTNKPTDVEKSIVPHHFIETCLSPFSENNIQDFVLDATNLIEHLGQKNLPGTEREQVAIVCGGTCYYAQGLIFESVVQETKEGGEKPLTGDPNESLWETVHRLDPARAQKIHPKDTRRLERFLEVGSGSAAAGEPEGVRLRYGTKDTFVLWVDWNDSKAHMEALDARVDKMVRRGLLTEVQDFYTHRFSPIPSDESVNTERSKRGRDGSQEERSCESTTSGLGSAIGFKEFLPALKASASIEDDSASCSPWKDCIDVLKTSTRRYAKQQRRWIINRFLEKYIPSVPAEERSQLRFLRLARDAAVTAPKELDELLDSTVRGFLENRHCQLSVAAPESLILTNAETILEGKEKVERSAQINHCALCDKTTMDTHQWKQHMQSKQHLGALRRERNIRELAERGIIITPKNKKNEEK